MIELKQYVVSIMGTNSFLLMDKDTKALALVDPGEFSAEILNLLILQRLIIFV